LVMRCGARVNCSGANHSRCCCRTSSCSTNKAAWRR
jgi:hypothetical protein